MIEELQKIIDKDALRTQLFNYCRAVDRLDIELGRSVFYEDSYADYGEQFYRGPGKDVINAICEYHLSMISHSHQVTNILIVLEGEKAASEAYLTATLRLEQEGRDMRVLLRARYLDKWEKRGGYWAIVHRELAYDHADMSQITPMPGADTGRRDRSDRSYFFLKGSPSAG
jgi:hypothetical protein